MRRAVERARGSRSCAAAALVIAIGCGARTAIEADGAETETEEEATTSSSGTGRSGPSQGDCDAATGDAYEAANVVGADRDEVDKAVIDACCAAGCRPHVFDTHIIDCAVECIASPDACTAAEECDRQLGPDLCGFFSNHIVYGRCHEP